MNSITDTSFFTLFCFYESPDPLDLHSFPTRRSSDLLGVTRREAAEALEEGYRDALAAGGKAFVQGIAEALDRKSTRLNSSHRCISYAVFCLKKKRKELNINHATDLLLVVH